MVRPRRDGSARNLRVITIIVGGLCLAAPGLAQYRPIDSERSTVHVRVFTTGAFAHTYVIEAPVMDGSLGEPARPHLQIAFDARRMRVLNHPALSAKHREEVQVRMLGPDVLDVARFPWISYHSVTMKRDEGGVWIIRGELFLHGDVRPLTVKVVHEKNHYIGSVTFRLSDFGMTPVSVMGDTVKVKDEIEIRFNVIPEAE